MRNLRQKKIKMKKKSQMMKQCVQQKNVFSQRAFQGPGGGYELLVGWGKI